MKRTLVGLESVERGIPRDGYSVLDLKRQRDRLRHQRLVRAVPEEEHRAGVRAGRTFGRGYRRSQWKSGTSR